MYYRYPVIPIHSLALCLRLARESSRVQETRSVQKVQTPTLLPNPSRVQEIRSPPHKLHTLTLLPAENGGTFVRLAKLALSVQPRVTVLQALRLRYQGAAVDSAADSSMTLGGATARGRVLVALVGQEEVLQRQGRLDHLVKAALIDSCVFSAVCSSAFVRAMMRRSSSILLI